MYRVKLFNFNGIGVAENLVRKLMVERELGFACVGPVIQPREIIGKEV